MKYELNEGQVKNIIIFLSRTTLQGKEVDALNEIITLLSNPIKDKEKESEENINAEK